MVAIAVERHHPPAHAAGEPLTAQLDGTQLPGSKKQSPYAAAKDEVGAAGAAAVNSAKQALDPLTGNLAPGSEKESPYSAAQEVGGAALEPTLAKLWGLLLPLGLAGGSYAWLRSRERS